MAIPVLILGESGTGKSASLRNFKADEVKVINVEGKPLPFKNKFETFDSDNYVNILKSMRETSKPVIVVDDAQYLMANEFMRRATERGYDKFTEIAQNFWNLVNKVKELPKHQIVYFLAHIERDQNGNEKIKTIGKLLDEKITVEGMFTIVLKTNVNDGEYIFITQNSGHDTIKSPMGMFKSIAIDNDLKYVDDKIRNYYEIGEFKSDAEMAIEDDAVAAEAPAPKEKKPRRGRKSLTEEKKEAIKEAQAELANAYVESKDQDEEVPFEETETPEITTEIPKRKKRAATENVISDVAPDVTAKDADIQESVEEKPTKTIVRRRVRKR